MLQQPEPDDYMIATGETNTLESFVSESFRFFGLNWQEHVVTDSSLLRPSEIMVSCGNPARVLGKLGWSSRFKMRDVVRMMGVPGKSPGKSCGS